MEDIKTICPGCGKKFRHSPLEEVNQCPACGLMWNILDFGKRIVLQGAYPDGTFVNKILKEFGER